MSDKKNSSAQRKFYWQILAFGLVMLPPVGLYFSVTLGATWVTGVLLGLMVAGMFLTMRVA